MNDFTCGVPRAATKYGRGTTIAGSLFALPVDNMPTLPILTDQVAQLLDQTPSLIMSTVTIFEPDATSHHLAEQCQAGLNRAPRVSPRDGCAGRDFTDSRLPDGSQLFNTESRDR